MRTACVGVVALLAILWTASDGGADPRSHGRSDGARSGRSFQGHGHSLQHRGRSLHHEGVGRHRVFPRHFNTLGVVVAPPVVFYSAPLFDPGPRYYSPPVYAPPVMYSAVPFAPPAPPPPPRVVHYPTGRYELHGDGIAAPYSWVWIPNPPPPPPAPPTAPPAGTPNEPPASGDALPARQQVYRWVDEQGVAHWTNRVDRVPRRYREEAQR